MGLTYSFPVNKDKTIYTEKSISSYFKCNDCVSYSQLPFNIVKKSEHEYIFYGVEKRENEDIYDLLRLVIYSTEEDIKKLFKYAIKINNQYKHIHYNPEYNKSRNYKPNLRLEEYDSYIPLYYVLDDIEHSNIGNMENFNIFRDYFLDG